MERNHRKIQRLDTPVLRGSMIWALQDIASRVKNSHVHRVAPASMFSRLVWVLEMTGFPFGRLL